MTSVSKTVEYGFRFLDGEVWDGYPDLEAIVAEVERQRASASPAEIARGVYQGTYVKRTRTVEETDWEQLIPSTGTTKESR